jgi:hypothetical protein
MAERALEALQPAVEPMAIVAVLKALDRAYRCVLLSNSGGGGWVVHALPGIGMDAIYVKAPTLLGAISKAYRSAREAGRLDALPLEGALLADEAAQESPTQASASSSP